MQIEIDGEEITSERDALQTLKDQLFPDRGFGWNRSSLLDALGTDVERPVQITWVNAKASCANLGAATFGELCSLLASVAAQDRAWGLTNRLEFTLA